jgi:hypothetical protein
MILKEKDSIVTSTDKRVMAGERQEADLAFYLRRNFKDRADVLVINDLRFSHNEEVAQIDHLVITELGFCLIESKSIKATVKINKEGEWSREYSGKLTGIASPIKQVELQSKLLKELLRANKKALLGKILGLQEGFDGRRWTAICAVSSDAVIERTHLTDDLNKRILKSEFIADWVNLNAAREQGIIGKIKSLPSTDPVFKLSEINQIANFLLSKHLPKKTTTNRPPNEVPIYKPDDNKLTSSYETLCCKQCKSTENLTAMSGRYGYYVTCSCGTNTSMKTACTICRSDMGISKAKEIYSATCSCGDSFVRFPS